MFPIRPPGSGAAWNVAAKNGKTALSIDANSSGEATVGFELRVFHPLAVLGVSWAAHPHRPSSVFTETVNPIIL